MAMNQITINTVIEQNRQSVFHSYVVQIEKEIDDLFAFAINQ